MCHVSIRLKVKCVGRVLGLMNLCYRLENLSIGRDIYKGLDVMQRYGVMWVYVELVGLGSSSSMEPFSS